MPAIGLTGRVFGRLTVVGQVQSDKHRRSCWLCRCECGIFRVVAAHELRTGDTKSCGCLRREAASERVRKYRELKREAYEKGTQPEVVSGGLSSEPPITG